uniref:ATP-binding cassette, subfamily G (WHITE), member 2 n=1 Tax=Tetraselmis sp. GSL018 TaxID=582737 RepID=A0A061QMI1_9CHLO
MASAAAFFEGLGYASPSPSVHIIDHMLDVAIRSPAEEVTAITEAFTSSDARREDAAVLLRTQYDDAMTCIHNSRSHWLLKYEASPWTQLKILSERQLRTTFRHPALIGLNFGATGFVAVLLGSIYYQTGIDSTGALQNRFGALFFIIIFQALMSLSSLPLWEQDRVLFHRERLAGAYSTGPYFLSVVLYDLLALRCLPPLLFVLITYGLVGLRQSAQAVARFGVVLVLSNIAGATVNMWIGAALDSTAVANAVGSIYCLCSILLSGFLRSNHGMPAVLQSISQLSFLSHSFEALLISEFGFGATGFRYASCLPLCFPLLSCRYGALSRSCHLPLPRTYSPPPTSV